MAEQPAGVSLRRVGRSAVILTGGSVAVQVVAIGRELFVAAQVGLSRNLDALLIALVVPITLSSLLTSGTVTALIPAYLEARRQDGPVAARRLAGTILSWTAVAAAILVLIVYGLATPLLTVLGPGLNAASRDAAGSFLLLLAPVGFFAAMAGILTAICQAEERFAAIALASFAGPVTTLLTLLALWGSLGLTAYALGSLLGPLVEGSVLAIATAHYRVLPLPGLRVRGLGLGAFVRHAWPLTLSSAILQLNLVADRAVASLLAPGAVSALRYADVLVRSPITAIAPAWSAAMYPAQVRAAAGVARRGVGLATSRSIGFALAAFVPLAAVIAALAPLGVQVAYARGAFGGADVPLTAGAVAAFSPLIVMHMISPVLVGAHNARRRGMVLLATGSMNAVMNLAFDIVLGAWLGVAGVALSSSLTATILVIFLARRLAVGEDDFAIRPLLVTTGRALAAVAVPAAAAAFVAWRFAAGWSFIVTLGVAAALGLSILALYGIVALRLGLDEVRTLLRIVAERLSRRRAAAPNP